MKGFANPTHSMQAEKVPSTMTPNLTTFLTDDGVKITPKPIQVQYVKSLPQDQDQSGTDMHFNNGKFVHVTAEHDDGVDWLRAFLDLPQPRRSTRLRNTAPCPDFRQNTEQSGRAAPLPRKGAAFAHPGDKPRGKGGCPPKGHAPF